MQGLDGEATERMIEHLAEPASEQQEPEQEYAVAKVLAEDAPSGHHPSAYVTHWLCAFGQRTNGTAPVTESSGTIRNWSKLMSSQLDHCAYQPEPFAAVLNPLLCPGHSCGNILKPGSGRSHLRMNQLATQR